MRIRLFSSFFLFHIPLVFSSKHRKAIIYLSRDLLIRSFILHTVSHRSFRSSHVSLTMTTFSAALAALGPFDPAWLIPRQNTYFQYTHMEVPQSIVKLVSTMSSGQSIVKSESTMSSGHRNAVVPFTTSLANDVAKAGSASKSPVLNSVLNSRIEKSTSSSRAPVTLKPKAKAASTSKHAQLGSKANKPALNPTLSSQTRPSTASPRETTSVLPDPIEPPPKKGSFLELMSRKASDMEPLPRKREPTGKQIKEAAKAAKKALGARKKKPHSVHTDPHLRRWSVKERNELVDNHRRRAHEQTKKKIPRRAYNGTGAIGQGSSQSTAGVLPTAVPLERSESLQSASSSNTSSSGMEAGYMDVVEEESRAAARAKQEDDEEARLEAQLKMAKDRRRMREAQAKPRQ